jgi:cation diffusion facilitator family transporter
MGADESHPFGYGMEAYFWGFVVALMVFFAGGAVAVWEGVEKLLHPRAISHPLVSLGVCAVSAVFEGLSFRTAYKEYRRMVRGRDVPLWNFVRASKDPSLFATLLEDGASLTGLTLAAAGVIGVAYLGLAWADPAASIAIGALLIAIAVVMANETRSLIAGEAAADPIVEQVKASLGRRRSLGMLEGIRTLHLGPDRILVALNWRFRPGLAVEDIEAAAQAIKDELSQTDGRITEVLFAPPDQPMAPARAAKSSQVSPKSTARKKTDARAARRTTPPALRRSI